MISHGSALYLAGLSDRMSYASDVTVLHGYNPRGLTREHLTRDSQGQSRRLQAGHYRGEVSLRRNGEGVQCGADGGRPNLPEIL